MENNAERITINPKGVWLGWILVNGSAVIIAIVAALPLVINLAYVHQPAWLNGAVGGAGLGLALGVAQWWL
ncbi:MAG: hypothetical protein R2911_44175, partial [Caldilineaceae bacterium]